MNRRNTVPCSPVPQAGRLPVGRVRSPVIFFVSSGQLPVDCGTRIRHTGLAFYDLSSQANCKASEARGQPPKGSASCFVLLAHFTTGPLAFCYVHCGTSGGGGRTSSIPGVTNQLMQNTMYKCIFRDMI